MTLSMGRPSTLSHMCQEADAVAPDEVCARLLSRRLANPPPRASTYVARNPLVTWTSRRGAAIGRLVVVLQQ